jgi:hypothetical protein
MARRRGMLFSTTASAIWFTFMKRRQRFKIGYCRYLGSLWPSPFSSKEEVVLEVMVAAIMEVVASVETEGIEEVGMVGTEEEGMNGMAGIMGMVMGLVGINQEVVSKVLLEELEVARTTKMDRETRTSKQEITKNKNNLIPIPKTALIQPLYLPKLNS